MSIGQIAKLPLLPAQAPRITGQAPVRALGKLVVGMSSWRVSGEFPDLPKLVAIAAPHSSNWDGFFGIAAIYALGLRVSWMGKSSLFRYGLGPAMRGLGGIATERSNPRGAVGQMVDLIAAREQIWLALAPEGTRKVVPAWRSGFWHIAHEAQVPIMPVYIDFPSKTIGLMAPLHTSGDKAADLQRIYQLYLPWRGKGGKHPLPPGAITPGG